MILAFVGLDVYTEPAGPIIGVSGAVTVIMNVAQHPFRARPFAPTGFHVPI